VGFGKKNRQTNHHGALAVWRHTQKKRWFNIMKDLINRLAARAGSPDSLAAVSSRMHPKNALAPEPPRAIRSHPEFVRIFFPPVFALFFKSPFKTGRKMPALMRDTTH